jgi:phospholipase C
MPASAGPVLGRRAFLGALGGGVGLLGGTAGGAGAAGIEAAVHRVIRAATTCPAGPGARLADIGHVVILMQENRSFDHILGAYHGTRGFADHPPTQLGAFSQAFPANTKETPVGRLLPFHFDTTATNAACTNDITHEWGPQHQSWNGGRMDRFVAAHVAADGVAAGTATMGYYTRADLPFTYALADAFTVCDSYFSSTMAPTYPNRLYSMTATIDPGGLAGGPVVTNPNPGPGNVTGIYDWTTMPERLQAAGVTWKVYSQASTNNNMLPLFKKYLDPTSPLFANGVVPTWPASFDADVAAGTLPQVSWVLAPMSFDEHPPAPIAWGEWVTAQVLARLVGNPSIWSKTVMFLTYDENGGFFDHLPPPVAPAGTPGEYLTVPTLPPEAAGVRGPIGLGFRVPMIVISPFSRGGLVCPDVFDHTSLLRFIETRFGVEVPNLSAWRRAVTGDLTSSLNLASPADPAVPALPSTSLTDPRTTRECAPGVVVGTATSGPNYPLPPTQTMPGQESGPSPGRPSGLVGASCPPSTTTTTSRAGAGPATTPGGDARPVLPATGRQLNGTEGLAALAIGLALTMARRLHRHGSA